MARALANIPAPQPLPNRLPIPPKAPISYLGSLTERIETTDTLSYEDQSSLLLDLKQSVREPGTTNDTRTLLERFRRRRDLFAVIAEEIDEILTQSSAEPKTEKAPNYREVFIKTSPSKRRDLPRKNVTQIKRIEGSCYGIFLEIIVGIIALSNTPYPSSYFILVPGAGGAISGAISGMQRQVIYKSSAGALFMWLALFPTYLPQETFRSSLASSGALGIPLGAIIGAIIGVILRNRQK